MTIPAAGGFPAGLFVPENYDVSGPPGILAYAYDYRTRDIISLERGVHPIDDQVIIAISAYRFSGAALEKIGARWFDIDKLDERAGRLVEGQARLALKTLVDNADIRIEKLEVEIDTGAQQANLRLQWKNLRSVSRLRIRTFTRSVNVRRPEAIRPPIS